jgi:anti-anti-sigma regulatory factor
LAARLLFSRPGVAMLKISTIESTKELVKIRIDGQIGGEGVKLMQKTCTDHLVQGLKLSVDLQNVSFVDREGIVVLRKLQQHQVEFLNTPLFITEQIRKP